MAMLSTMRAALRPTLRDIKRHWWRSILAVLLVALPVGVFAYNVSNDATRTQAEQSIEMRNQATYFARPCEQNIFGWDVDCQDAQSQGAGPKDKIEEALPEGFQAHLAANILVHLSKPQDEKTAPNISSLSVRDPATLQFGNHAPRQGEIVLSLDDAQRLGIGVGDEVEVHISEDNTQAAPRTEVLKVSDLIGARNSVITPGTIFSEQELERLPDSRWVLSGPRPMNWQDVKDLNAQGYVVQSQDVADNPPAHDELYPQFADPGSTNGAYGEGVFFFVVSATILAIAAVLILLSIAPVFAISAAQRGETFALMRSQGASRRHIRIAVLGYGFVAGALGAVAGLIVGASANAIVWKSRLPEASIAWPWKMWLFGFVMAIVGALLASYLPAWLAARSNIAQTAGGGRVDRMRRWRPWMAIGPALIVVILLMSWLSASRRIDHEEKFVLLTSGPLPDLGLLLGIVFSVPAMILACSTLRRPLMVRLAATLMRRQALRSASALAAIAGIVLIASLLVQQNVIETSKRVDLSARTYNTSVLGLESWDDSGEGEVVLDQARNAVEQHLQVTHALKVQSTERDYRLNPYPDEDSLGDCDNGASEEAPADCDLPVFFEPAVGFVLNTPSQVMIAEPALLDAFKLSPEDRTAAEAAMRSGAVLASSDYAKFSPKTIEEYSYKDEQQRDIDAQIATLLPEGSREMIMTPATAQRLDVKPQGNSELLFLDDQPSGEAIRQVRQAVQDADRSAYLNAYPTPQSPADSLKMSAITALPLLIIIAIISVLGLKDLRRMQEQLANVGASSKQLRALAAISTGLLAALGTWIPLAVAYATSWFSAQPAQHGADGAIYDYGTRDWVGINPIYTAFILLLVPLAAFAIGAMCSWKPKPPGYRVD